MGVEQGGSGCHDIGIDLFSGGASIPDIRVRDMVPDTVYAEGIGQILP